MSLPDFLKNEIDINYKLYGKSYLILTYQTAKAYLLTGKISNYFLMNSHHNTCHKISKQEYIKTIIETIFNRESARLKIRSWLERRLYHPQIVNNQDLEYNEFKDNDSIILHSGGQFFQFSSRDLTNIITNSLENTEDEEIIDPKAPKNPYNNQIFNSYHLSKIYNFLQNQLIPLNKTMVLFKYSKFNIKYFYLENYEYLFRKQCETYIKQLDVLTKMIDFRTIKLDSLTRSIPYHREMRVFFVIYEDILNNILIDYRFYKFYLIPRKFTEYKIECIGRIYKNYTYLCDLYDKYLPSHIHYHRQTHKKKPNRLFKKKRISRRKPISYPNRKMVLNYIDNIFTFSEPLTINIDPYIFDYLQDIYKPVLASHKWLNQKTFEKEIFIDFISELQYKITLNDIRYMGKYPYPLFCPKYIDYINIDLVPLDLTNDIIDLLDVLDTDNNSDSDSSSDSSSGSSSSDSDSN